jgi:hypothetical protein
MQNTKMVMIIFPTETTGHETPSVIIYNTETVGIIDSQNRLVCYAVPVWGGTHRVLPVPTVYNNRSAFIPDSTAFTIHANPKNLTFLVLSLKMVGDSIPTEVPTVD